MSNNNITNEDLIGLHRVNVNALVRNLLKYGQGNYNTSPNIRSKRLNDFPKMEMINKSYIDEEPVYVPKLKLPKWMINKNKLNNSVKRKRNNSTNSNISLKQKHNNSIKRKRNMSNNSNNSKKGGSLTRRSKAKRT